MVHIKTNILLQGSGTASEPWWCSQHPKSLHVVSSHISYLTTPDSKMCTTRECCACCICCACCTRPPTPPELPVAESSNLGQAACMHMYRTRQSSWLFSTNYSLLAQSTLSVAQQARPSTACGDSQLKPRLGHQACTHKPYAKWLSCRRATLPLAPGHAKHMQTCMTALMGEWHKGPQQWGVLSAFHVKHGSAACSTR